MSKPKQHDEWLATLLPPRKFAHEPPVPTGAVSKSDALLEIPLDSLDANPYQTRTTLDEKSLDELADSIRGIGLLEPIVVRANGNGRYQVIAGERRVKACYLAGVHKIPAVVRDVTDRQAAAMTVIENLQREDVNPIDQANGFRRLVEDFGFTHGQIVERTGKSRTAVSNCLCLLHLPDRVQDTVRSGKLSAGHAKALLALDGQPEDVMQDFASQAVALSVRETERRIRRFLRSDESDPTIEPGRWLRPKVLEAERDLRRNLSAKVVITERGGQGHIRIPFADLYELERLYTAITGDELEIAYRPPRSE